MEQKGYGSRKLHMAYVVMGLLCLGFAAAGIWPSLAVVYAEYCMAVLGAASIYAGANSAVKWIAGRNLPAASTSSPVKKSGLQLGPPIEPPAPE